MSDAIRLKGPGRSPGGDPQSAQLGDQPMKPLEVLTAEMGFVRTEDMLESVAEEGDYVPGICVKCGSIDDGLDPFPTRTHCQFCGQLAMRTCFSLANLVPDTAE